MRAPSLAAAVAALLAATATVARPTPRQDGLQVINNCVNNGQVAATFDDGPWDYELDVDYLLGNDSTSKGTFFLNGNNYVCIYDRVDQIRALHAAGHTLGCHTWSHADLTTLDVDGINSELQQVEDAFVKILGLKPLYFRPPYGNYNQQVLDILAQRGYKKVFMWSADTGDADGESVQYSENVWSGVINNYPQPALVLSHSTIQTTSTQVLPWALPQLKAKGYQLVAVDTCLGSDGEWPYEYVGEPGTPDATWTC